jgi:hypothetical protein
VVVFDNLGTKFGSKCQLRKLVSFESYETCVKYASGTNYLPSKLVHTPALMILTNVNDKGKYSFLKLSMDITRSYLLKYPVSFGASFILLYTMWG